MDIHLKSWCWINVFSAETLIRGTVRAAGRLSLFTWWAALTHFHFWRPMWKHQLHYAKWIFERAASLLVSDRNEASPVGHSCTSKARSWRRLVTAIWPQRSHQRQLWFWEINIILNGVIPWCHFASQHAKWLPQGASSWTARTAQLLWRRSLKSKRKVSDDLPRQRSDPQMSPMCLLEEQNKVVKECVDVCGNLLALTHDKKPSSVAMATKCQGWMWGWKQVIVNWNNTDTYICITVK